MIKKDTVVKQGFNAKQAMSDLFSLEKDTQMFCPTRNLTEWTYYCHYVVLYMSKTCVNIYFLVTYEYVIIGNKNLHITVVT